MVIKDRRIHLFLQLFFLLIGLYQFVKLLGGLQTGQLSSDLFEFHFNDLPVINLSIVILCGITSLVSSFAIWTRAAWMYGFALFTSGILFSYHLVGLGTAIYQNSYEIIPIVLVLIVLLQSLPYLLKRSYRSA